MQATTRSCARDLEAAVAIPSKSILFNIDQKADVISKTQIDALLAVFVKVFDEMCGYYGKQGYIAQFERDLDSRGLYGAFKQAYPAIRRPGLGSGPRAGAAGRRTTSRRPTRRSPACRQPSAQGILDKYRASTRSPSRISPSR